MALNPIKFITSDSATATEGIDVVVVSGNTDCRYVYSGTAVFLGSSQVVEAVGGTAPDSSGNSIIRLRYPWPFPTTTDRVVAINTIEGMAESIRYAREVVLSTDVIADEADRAKVEADRANNEATRGQVAADQASLTAGIYPDIAAGLAAVQEGSYFSVPSSTANDYLNLFRKVGGLAIDTSKKYPTSVFVESMDNRLAVVESDFYPMAAAVLPSFSIGSPYVWGVLDGLNRLGIGLRHDGTLQAKFKDLAFEGAVFDPEYQNIEEDVFAIVDEQGKVGLRIKRDGTLVGKMQFDLAELQTARGIRTTLDERLSVSLNQYGLPQHYIWGEWYLRETRQRLRKRLLGEASTLSIASIGDSWTHNAGRWCGPTASTLKTEFGDAGAGYVSFARNGSSLPNGNIISTAVVTYTGTWNTSAYYSNFSPDLGSATSSTTGDRLSYSIATDPSAVELYAAGGVGAIQYRFNGGAWQTIDLSSYAAELQVINLPSALAGIFDIEIVSGAPVLFGINVKTTTDGVRWHKLGATGSRSQQWVSVDEVQWKKGIQSLAANLVIILHGTNDQPAYDAITYRTHMQTLISRVRSALPLADILLIAPCENGRVNTYPMSTYAAALYELASVNKCAYLNLQFVFGESFSEYSDASNRAWFNSDLIHPEPFTGGRAIADAVIRLLKNS